MAMFTNFMENKLVDFLFRGQALGITGATAAAGTGPATWYVGLLTAAATDAAPGTEVTGGSYARVAIPSSLASWAGTQAAASTVASTGTGGTTSNNAALTFPAPTANWGSIVGFALYDAPIGGNQCVEAELTTPKTVNAGDAAPVFIPASLSLQIDD